MWNQKPSFRFEVNNFSEKKDGFVSRVFLSNGYQWYVLVHPKGDKPAGAADHLSLYLVLLNPKLLPSGWKKSAKFHFVVLNKSGKELYKSPIGTKLFCAEHPSWGFRTTLPVTKLQEEGVLEKDILIVEVYIESLVEVISEKKKKETADINGFQVLASKVALANKILAEHPDIAVDLKPKDQEVKNEYMKVLLKLIRKLEKYPRRNLSETELSKAWRNLSELRDVGFKVDWLKSKLDEISLEKKKAEADASRVLKLEMDSLNTNEVVLDYALKLGKLDRRLKSLELMELGSKFHSLKEKLDEVCIVREMSDSVCEARGEQVEKRIKNLELMEIGVKMETLETKLDEVSLERKKSDVADESRFQQLEEHVKELELMELGVKLDSLSIELEGSLELVESQAQELEDMRFEMCCLNKKLEGSLERKKSDESRIYQLEESVKDLVLMVSELKAELDKKKDKSFADGFLLVE